MTSKADHVRAAPNDDARHHCHWPGCKVQVKPALYSCRRHWFTWPEHIRNAIWAAYQPGQERTKRPSAAYLEASEAAQQWAIAYERTRAASTPNQGALDL